MKALKVTETAPEYFEELSEETQSIVRELVEETIGQVEGWGSKIESIECKSRDGFTAFSSNRGGLTALQFTDLGALHGSGTSVAHVKAQAEIERQIEYSLQCAKETFFQENEEELKALGIEDKDSDKLNYHDLYELKEGRLAEELSNAEHESLSDDQSSIMFEVRFLYHGLDLNGKHSASVSCAVNTEGPYHRSSIPWAPGVFCEGAEEIEIEWKTDAGLKLKLARAIKATAKGVF